MIALVKRYHAQKNKMTYEFSEGNNVCYIGRILCPTQINYLKNFGNTCISFDVYKTLGEKKVLEEVKDLTGLECYIDIYEHDFGETSVIIRAFGNFSARLIPSVVLDQSKNEQYYILFFGGEEIMRFKKKSMTLAEVKELLALNGVYDYETR